MAELRKTLYWCKNCHVPLLARTCDSCGSEGRRFITDVKPVFEGERKLLERALDRSLPEGIYASGSRLYYDGRLLLSFSTRRDQVVITKERPCQPSPDPVMGWEISSERAIRANMTALNCLERDAIQSIRQVIRDYPDRKPVVSFSGGKDSAVVAHLTAEAIGAQATALFFADTTLEHPETRAYVEQFAQIYSLPLTIKQADCDFYSMCEQLEPPSRIMRWCCTIFKANPLNSYLQEQGRLLSFDGIRRAESHKRRGYQQMSGNKKAIKQLVFRPILDWSSYAVWLYIFAHRVPYNPAYDRGYARVGCVICPFSKDFDDFLTRQYYPDRVHRWETMLGEYFLREYSDRFDSTMAEEWVRDGLWKQRKAHHHHHQAVHRLETCPSLKQYVYELDRSVDATFLEYLKPLGEVTYFDGTDSFRIVAESRFCITGVLGDNQLDISFSSEGFRSNMYLLERQVKKAMNCIACGACVGTCPLGAIHVQPSLGFEVDVDTCTHCLLCVKSDFTHYGCVALSYKRSIRGIA